MIPLRDSIRSRRFPVINVGLIIINVLVFFFELALTHRELNVFTRQFGLIPVLYRDPFLVLLKYGIEGFYPFLTSMFLHNGWLHVAGNMLFLWVFGDNVEDRLGHLKYLFFYLLVGVISGVVHVVFNISSPVPTIGASGAVAGVLGAYFVMFPRARVLALVPLGFFLTVAEVPAVVFLVLWFLLQLFSGVASIGLPANVGGVAWWAHVGGFAAGMLLVKVLYKRRRNYYFP
ncbi:MAG TPA: rhomboid family intramembrane serine protease [Firmicutes bacterium]|nr:rhomboid family intramembrane serine protease [Bacillota bacterium]